MLKEIQTPKQAVAYALSLGYCPELKVKRDRIGQWAHPVIDAYLDKYYANDAVNTQAEKDFLLRSYFGISVERRYLEEDDSLTDKQIIECQNDLNKWHPKAPDGYFLASLMHWEDGVVANFIKPHDYVTPYSDLRLVELFEEKISKEKGIPLEELKRQFRENEMLLGSRYAQESANLFMQYNDFRNSIFKKLSDDLEFQKSLEQYIDDYLGLKK